MNMDASTYHTFAHNAREGQEPSSNMLHFWLEGPEPNVADVLIDTGLCDIGAERNDEWNEISSAVMEICEIVGRAAGIIYNVHKDILEKTFNHNHEGDKYKKKLKNCIEKARKGAYTALLTLPESKVAIAQPLLDADIALLQHDCDHNLQVIVKDMEDLARGRALRNRHSIVPAASNDDHMDLNPVESTGFIPDGATGLQDMIDTVLVDPPGRDREAEGAIPKAVPAGGPKVTPDLPPEELIEFDPLAAAPNLANLKIGPALRTHAMKELRSIHPDNIENVSEQEVLKWIIGSMFAPMKQLITQEKLDNLDAKMQAEHDARIRMRSLMVGGSSTFEQAMMEKELTVVKQAKKSLIDWIGTNVLPFKEGELIPTDPVVLCSIIKRTCQLMTGIEIPVLTLPFLEELGSRAALDFFDQRLEFMTTPPDVRQSAAILEGHERMPERRRNNSVPTPIIAEINSRPASRLDGEDHPSRHAHYPAASGPSADNNEAGRDSDTMLNSINDSISSVDRGLEISISSLRDLNLGGPRAGRRDRAGGVYPGIAPDREHVVPDRGGLPPTRTSSPIYRNPTVRFPDTDQDHVNISAQAENTRRNPSSEYPHRDPYRERSDPYTGQYYHGTFGPTRSRSGERHPYQEYPEGHAPPYGQHDEYHGARSGAPVWQEGQNRHLSVRAEGILENLESRFRIVSNKLQSLKRLITILEKYEGLSTACKRETFNKYFTKIDNELTDYLVQHHEFVKAHTYVRGNGLYSRVPVSKIEEYRELERKGLDTHKELSNLFDECNESYANKEISRSQPSRADLQTVKYNKFSGRYGPRDLSFYEFKEEMERKMEICEIDKKCWGSKVRNELTDHANDIIPRELENYDKIMDILQTHFGSVPTNMGFYKLEHRVVKKTPELTIPNSASDEEAKAIKKAASEVAHDHLMLLTKVEHMMKVNPQHTALMYGEEYLNVLLEMLPSTEHLSISILIKSDPKAALDKMRGLFKAIYNQGATIRVTTSLEKKYLNDRRDPRPRPVKFPESKPRPRIMASLTDASEADQAPARYPPHNIDSQRRNPVPSPRERLNSYPRGERRVQYVNDTNYECVFCQFLQRTGQGENYYHNHPHTVVDGEKRLILTQCPNYLQIGATERKLLIQKTKTCPQCLRLLENHKTCLKPEVADRVLCHHDGCNMARIENCILHRAQNEERILAKQRGYSRSGNVLMMAMLPAVRPTEVRPDYTQEKGVSSKLVAFTGENPYDPLEEDDKFFYPKNKPRLTRDELEGERLSAGKTRLNFLLFGKIKGRKNGTVVLYDTGAEVCLFGTKTLEEELNAAPIIGGLKRPLASIGGGTVWGDPWEVSFPLKGNNTGNKIEIVYGRDNWGLNIKNSPLERDSVFRAKRDEFCQNSSRDISDINVASDFGDQIHGLIGTNVKHLFPEEVSTLSCGLTLYTSVLQPHDDSSDFLIGGPVEVFCREAGTNTLDASCVEYAFAMVHTIEGTLSPELRLSYYGIDEPGDVDEFKSMSGHNSNVELSDRAPLKMLATIEEVDQNTDEIDPSVAEIGDGFVKLDLNSLVQPNQVSMGDCMVGDAPRHREAECGRGSEIECEDGTDGKSVDDKINEVVDAWKITGSRDLNINVNYMSDSVTIQPRCVNHVDCSPCKMEDPFESLSLALLKENQILAKCLHFKPSNHDFVHNLPFKVDPYKTLLNNRSRAEATLERAVKKLNNASDEDRKTVSKSFMSLVDLGHIKEFKSLTKEQQIKIESKPINWFIPWNLTWKQSKSTPARVVFNASQKHGKYSLNDILYKGDMKTKLRLLGALFNFVRDRIGITTDISKFYNCLKLIEDNWNFQNVLWCPEMKVGSEVVRYIVTTAIYGVSSASVLTEQMFNNLASRVKDDKLVYWILMYGRYVDDILGSVKDLETALEMKEKITELLGKYKIRCKGWAISSQEPDESVSEDGIVGVGGYPFHVKEDVIQIKVPPLDFSGTKARGQLLGSVCFEGKTLEELDNFVPKQLTIRQALSKTSSIFDPRGIISPYTLLTKLAFQDSIQSLGGFGDDVLDKSTKKLNKKIVLTAKMWDLPLPKKQRAEWVRLFFMAEQIREFKFPRFPIPDNIDTSECYLFGYGDAANPGSQECVHIAFTNDGNCFHSFHLMGKNQVHSSKEAVRIPYKEMTAMSLTAALLQKCKLALPNVKGMKLFSDSEISLHWVKENGPDINNFIRGRCQIIRNYIDLNSLYHLKGNFNISDKGTRPIKDIGEISPSSSFYLGPDCMKDFKGSIDKGIITPLANLKKSTHSDQNEADAHVDKSELMEDHLVMAPLISLDAKTTDVRSRRHRRPTTMEEEAIISYVEECLNDITSEQIVDAYQNITGRKPVTKKRQLPINLKFERLGELKKAIELRSNCWFKVCRTLGYVLKACDLFNKNSEVTLVSRIKKARTMLLQSGISETEKMLKDRPIKGFIQTKDSNGLIRVQTRITHGKQNENSLIVVSPALTTATQILFSYHCITHSGVFTTVSKSRVCYWIPQAAKLARKIIQSCTKCRLLDAERLSQLMAPLPPFRTKASPPWFFTMVDLFGPIRVRGFVKRRTFRKTWAVIFTCLYTRAIWVYLAESYSTDSFLNVIRKHESRNGSASVYYADLGSQIKGADKTMQEAIRNLDKKALLKFSARNNTTFKFGIPLHSAGQGPVERLIREVKRCIKIISDGLGTFGETETMLFEASYMVNSRPLQFYPRAGEDGFICPNDILFGRSTKEPPAMDFENCGLAQRSAEQQRIMSEFWEQWSASYLQNLHRYQRWIKGERNLRPGDLVLVLDKKVFPGKFLTGEIASVVRGDDGKVRRVNVKYKLHKDNGRTQIIKARKFKYFERSPHGLALLLSMEERDVIGIPLADLDGEIQNNEPVVAPEALLTPMPQADPPSESEQQVNFNGKMIQMKKCEVRLTRHATEPKSIDLNDNSAKIKRCEVKLKRLPDSLVKQLTLKKSS